MSVSQPSVQPGLRYFDVTQQCKALAYALNNSCVPNSHTVNESEADQSDAAISAPFACPANLITDKAVFYLTTTSSMSLADPNGPLQFSLSSSSTSGSYSSIRQSDVALFGSGYAMWINGTQPAFFPGIIAFELPQLPDNAFPFTRLASVSSADRKSTFLYHQINGTTFAEEQWDSIAFAWTTSAYFTVSGS